MANELAEIGPDRRIKLNLHPGQARAWLSEKRFIGVIAGTQSGKTSFGPFWLYKEIQTRGPGDYIIATPTFQLLAKKLLPEFKKLFRRWLRLGDYNTQDKRFTFSPDGWRRTFGALDPNGEPYTDGYIEDHPCNVWFGYAADPDSLESATAKAAWLDEAGQKKFKRDSYDAILRRLSIAEGRVLVTTTPYDLGWTKQEFFDKARADHPDYDFINFDSTENPNFPKAEMERARDSLPVWKYDLFYRGIYTRPAGMIYDCFIDELQGVNPAGHLIRPFSIPTAWKRHLGLDFGGVNTAGVYLAAEQDSTGRETGRYIAYREYKAGGKTAAEHARDLMDGEPRMPNTVGGSHSEDQWRKEFGAGEKQDGARIGGLSVQEPPIKDVEVGIDRVYGAFRRGQLLVFDTLMGLRGQIMSYSRELDDDNEPTEEIEDKAKYHFLDALRYVSATLFGDMPTVETSTELYDRIYNSASDDEPSWL